MDEIKLVFEMEKETPGTYRYKEIGPDEENPSVGSLYVKKRVLGEHVPSRLIVTVREDR